jgi:hypothetical protein
MKRTIVRFGVHSVLLLTMILCFGNLNAQTDVLITSTEPTGAASLQVGYNQASFSLTVSNTGTTALIANNIADTRNGRLKSDFAGYGSEMLNVTLVNNQMVFSSNQPMRSLVVRLDTVSFRGVTFSDAEDLSGIGNTRSSAPLMWFEWTGPSFNTEITDHILALSYTGTLPDTMRIPVSYSYYENYGLKSKRDTIDIILITEEPVIEEPGTEEPVIEEPITEEPGTPTNESKSVAVNLQPVPAYNELLVKSNFTMDNIIVFDMLGRELNVPASIDADNATLDVSELSQGVYLLQVFGTNGEFAQESFTKM